MKEQTRKDMQQKLADYRQPAPEISWVELEKALAANRHSKAVPIWGKLLATAAAVLLVAGLGWQLLKTDNHTEGQQPTALTTTAKSNVLPSESARQDKDEQVASVQERKHMPPSHVRQNPTVQTESLTKETTSDTTTYSSIADTPVRQQTVYPSDLRYESSSVNNRLTAKIYLSNSFAGANGVSTISSQLDAEGLSRMINGVYPTSYDNQEPVIEEHANHHQPIRLGVSVRYQLSPRWSIEAGLSYSYLSSDITRKTAVKTSKIEQKLSYIGIPVNANYTLWSNRRFNVYASAGAVVEKMVSGSRYNEDYAKTENVTISPLQFSLNCAAGAEFNLDRIISIYAEPGLTYHFDNHSTIPTFYQDNPFGFNLNLGLRLNFNKK